MYKDISSRIDSLHSIRFDVGIDYYYRDNYGLTWANAFCYKWSVTVV